MNLLDEGTTTRTGDQLVEELGGLGTRLSSGGGGETSVVSFSALKPTLLPSLRIFADVVLHPAFAPKDFDRLKEQILAGIAAAKQDPNGEAGRDRKSTRLKLQTLMRNSYAVFCLKKKKTKDN